MTPAPVKATIPFSVFSQIDVRVGTIVEVTEIPSSDKLMRLRVGFGDRERTIVAGIRQERENPKEVEGKQALFVVNLEPRKVFGVVSEGMLFDIGYSDRIRPVLAVPESPVPDGSRCS
jgi:tRNA-binding protein